MPRAVVYCIAIINHSASSRSRKIAKTWLTNMVGKQVVQDPTFSLVIHTISHDVCGLWGATTNFNIIASVTRVFKYIVRRSFVSTTGV